MKKKSGTRHEVMSGIAKMTGGGLRKKDLKINNKGKIVSKKLSKIAKERNNLQIGGGDTIQFSISDRSKSLKYFLEKFVSKGQWNINNKITEIYLDAIDNGAVINWTESETDLDKFLKKKNRRYLL